MRRELPGAAGSGNGRGPTVRNQKCIQRRRTEELLLNPRPEARAGGDEGLSVGDWLALRPNIRSWQIQSADLELPNMWIKRDLEQALTSRPTLPAQVVIGPRQCGKSSLLSRISSDDFSRASMDDLSIRRLAQTDPALFFEQYPPPVIVDEAQHAPALFSAIKAEIDERRRTAQGSAPPLFRLTGSNQILMDRNVKESLAGRASYFRLHTLSLHEHRAARPELSVAEHLFRGGWPELAIEPALSPVEYLNDYILAYVEKDVAITAGIEKLSEFSAMLGLLAARTGEILNFDSLARDCGASSVTMRSWIGLLERAGVCGLLRPYFSNLNKRLVKSPKFFMLDSGLACRLQGHLSQETMLRSPQAGHLFETLVLGEIVRARDHNRMPWELFYWRTRDGEEFDFVLRAGRKVAVLDAQMAIQSARPIQASPSLRHAFTGWEIIVGAVTFGGKTGKLSADCWQIPVADLRSFLIKALAE